MPLTVIQILLLIFAVTAFSAFLLIVRQALLASRQDTRRFSELTISLLLLVAEVVLLIITYQSTTISAEALEVAKASHKQQQGIHLEYLKWEVELVAAPDGETALVVKGTRRHTTAQMKCFRLEIIPVYRSTSTNLVDDPDRQNQPRLTYTCHNLSVTSDDESRTEVITINDPLGELRQKYDGRPQLARIASTDAYDLHSFEIRLEYWHFSDKETSFNTQGRLRIDQLRKTDSVEQSARRTTLT